MKVFLIACSTVLVLSAAAVLAGAPENNISHQRHPNLAAAQRLTTQAYNRTVAAQRANEFDVGGHANKAKELLEQANRELKEAAKTSNANQR